MKTNPEMNTLIGASSIQKTKKKLKLIIKDDEDDAVIFTKKETENYNRQKGKSKFENPKEEYKWAKTQKKICSKCFEEKKLCDFNGNTSGTDAFDKNGYRLRRPECNKCTKNVSKGKTEAKKKAKELGISYIAPNGTICAVCGKSPLPGNGLVFDHCHVNNIFRGYCCNSCNRSIGVLGDNIDGLLRVINYLLKTENCTIIQNEKGELVKI
jgi:hypothetical protein